MTEELFIGIVKSPGTNETTWNGTFKFSETKGYCGKLLSTNCKIGNNGLFDLPEELDQDYLYCLIEGHEFGTIIWPRFPGGQSIKGFRARIVDTQIRNLIRRVHVRTDEDSIRALTLYSPVICRLFEIEPFIEKIETSPYKVSIENAPDTPLHFNSCSGRISISTSATYGRSVKSLSPKLEATGQLKFALERSISPAEALRLCHRIERLISLLTFDLVRMDRISFSVLAKDPSGLESEEICPVETAFRNAAAKSSIDYRDLPLRLNNIDFGDLLEKFLQIFEPIEQTLDWYRIVTAEERYLEDKFFYCVRMIEGLYRTSSTPAPSDQEALQMLSSIADKLTSDGESKHLAAFIEERITPIFRRSWSLSAIMKDLNSQYSEIATVQFLDAKMINRLRGKQAHGSSQRHSKSELQFMAYAYPLLSMIYCAIVLERCGLSRDFLLSGLKECMRFEEYFRPETLIKFREDCGLK